MNDIFARCVADHQAAVAALAGMQDQVVAVAGELRR